MLGTKDAIVNIAVKDLETARKFYGDVLALAELSGEGQHVIVFKSGNSKIIVYRSQYAGTNQATVSPGRSGGKYNPLCTRSRAEV